jgi:hypothetical protein
MAEDVSKLIVQVQSDSVSTAGERMDRMTGSAQKAEKATESLVGAAHKLVAEYVSVRAAYEAGRHALESVIEATKESESIQGKLRATTGASKAEAREMFTALDELEGKFAIPLTELTDAYSLLASRGLDPSRRALEKYADVAAGTGTSIGAVAESIAQGANGMFRGLNQLGVRATQEMDGLALTFRGTTTKIKGDAASIEQYVQQLGQDNFLGAAETQADSLTGSIFRLKDAWGDMWRAVAEGGSGEVIHKVVTMATDAVRELTDMIASGQLQGYIDAIIHKWDTFGQAFTDVVNFVKGAWQNAMEFLGITADDAAGFITHAFMDLPENVTAVVKGIGATFGLLVEYAVAVGKGVYNTIVGYFRYTWETVSNIGKLIWDIAKNPSGAGAALGEFYNKQTAAVADFGKTAVKAWDDTSKSIGNATDAWGEVITATMDERDAALRGFTDKIAAADQLRIKYEQVKVAKEKAGEDPLKRGQQNRGTDTASEAQRAQFEALKASLQLEEKTVQESYRKRMALVRNMTKEGSAERRELETALEQQTASAMAGANEKRLESVMQLEADLREAEAAGNLSKMDALRAQLSQEEAAMRESYDYRRQLIISNTTLTEKERQQKLLALQAQAVDQQRRIEVARNQSSLATTADFFGNVSKMAGAFGEKGAKIAKAAAIVQTTIKTYESATSAYASLAGIPYIGPALGAAAAGAAIAAGLANIAAIKSQNYSGAYATGGMIPAGSFGLVGETGVGEMVQGPAVVTSARATQDLRGRGTPGGNVTFNVINQAQGVEVVPQQERETPDGRVIDVLVRQVDKALAQRTRTGSSETAAAMAQTFGLRRGTS